LSFAGLSITPAGADDTVLHIFNKGVHTVQSIYQSVPERKQWGTDRLVGYLHPNNSWTSPLSDECIYDIKVVYTDEHEVTEYGMDVCKKDLNLYY
jgi:hypothetical protein